MVSGSDSKPWHTFATPSLVKLNLCSPANHLVLAAFGGRDMDRPLMDVQGGFAQRLGECGVRVANGGKVLGTRAEFHGRDSLCDQIARARAENVHAENTVGLHVGEHLDLSFGRFPSVLARPLA